MDSPVSPASYLSRAKDLCKSNDKASLIYAALELRCGVEARLQEHAAVARGLSKAQAGSWKIKKLGRSLDEAFGLGDSMLIVFVAMQDGRSGQFMYAPVSSRLREIGQLCGGYLHAIRPDKVATEKFWIELRAMIVEGCGLLQLACSSEILRPKVEDGLHFSMLPEDPRVQLVQDLVAGMPATFTFAKLTPTGPVTFYPADDAT